jgi:uncharacterized membrane protein (DUF2068 family)
MATLDLNGRAKRGLFLSLIAVLLAVLALSDFTKSLQHLKDPTKGLVLLGIRTETVQVNSVLGPIFGLILASYSYGLWRMKRWVFPLAVTYAFYVPLNLVLFWFRYLGPRPSIQFIVAYLAIALTGAIGTAIYLAYYHDRLV